MNTNRARTDILREIHKVRGEINKFLAGLEQVEAGIFRNLVQSGSDLAATAPAVAAASAVVSTLIPAAPAPPPVTSVVVRAEQTEDEVLADLAAAEPKIAAPVTRPVVTSLLGQPRQPIKRFGKNRQTRLPGVKPVQPVATPGPSLLPPAAGLPMETAIAPQAIPGASELCLHKTAGAPLRTN